MVMGESDKNKKPFEGLTTTAFFPFLMSCLAAGLLYPLLLHFHARASTAQTRPSSHPSCLPSPSREQQVSSMSTLHLR